MEKALYQRILNYAKQPNADNGILKLTRGDIKQHYVLPNLIILSGFFISLPYINTTPTNQAIPQLVINTFIMWIICVGCFIMLEPTYTIIYNYVTLYRWQQQQIKNPLSRIKGSQMTNAVNNAIKNLAIKHLNIKDKLLVFLSNHTIIIFYATIYIGLKYNWLFAIPSIISMIILVVFNKLINKLCFDLTFQPQGKLYIARYPLTTNYPELSIILDAPPIEKIETVKTHLEL